MPIHGFHVPRLRQSTSLAALTLLAIAMAPAAAQAEAPALITLNAQLGNLRFNLIDLDPNDGIAPGIAFETVKGFVGFDAFDLGDVTSVTAYEGSPLPDSALSKSDEISLSTANPQGLGSTMQLSLDQILAKSMTLPISNGNLLYGDPFTRSNLIAGDITPGPRLVPANFTLTPHTALEITGTASVTNVVDTAALKDWSTAQGYDRFKVRSDSAAVTVGVILPSDVSFDNMDFNSYQADNPERAFFFHAESMALSDTDPSTSVSQLQESILMRYINNGDTALGGQLALETQTFGATEIELYRPDTPPAVPEPGSLALMALGLCGLGLARRRRAS